MKLKAYHWIFIRKSRLLPLYSTILLALLVVGCAASPQTQTDDSVPTSSGSISLDSNISIMPDSSAVAVPSTPGVRQTELSDSFRIEVRDARGDEYTLSRDDLFHRFYNNAQISAVLVYSWESASDIEGHYLLNFFTAQTNWNQVASDDVIVHLPQEIVEDYLKTYFDTSSEQIRQAKLSYRPEEKSYELPMHPQEKPSIITDAKVDGNILSIFYETYDTFQESWPVLRQGYVTIGVERYPRRWKFLSNTITFDAGN